MWIKYFIIIVLFYFLEILQNSFFVHFNLFGAIPNLVFVLFFLLVYFDDSKNYYQIVFYAISAGLFLDLFSSTYFGVSITLLLLIGFLIKKAQAVLQEKKNNKFPFVYFLPLFIISLLVYSLLLAFFLYKFNIIKIISSINGGFAAEIVYDLLFASITFYIYKKFLQSGINDRQLKLFSKR
ncbi:MAG: rod shape-determining protein MreD [Candidatus Staskawiczbacteria bacterium]|jgi:rod shape-determining protein MreD